MDQFCDLSFARRPQLAPVDLSLPTGGRPMCALLLSALPTYQLVGDAKSLLNAQEQQYTVLVQCCTRPAVHWNTMADSHMLE